MLAFPVVTHVHNSNSLGTPRCLLSWLLLMFTPQIRKVPLGASSSYRSLFEGDEETPKGAQLEAAAPPSRLGGTIASPLLLCTDWRVDTGSRCTVQGKAGEKGERARERTEISSLARRVDMLPRARQESARGAHCRLDAWAPAHSSPPRISF